MKKNIVMRKNIKKLFDLIYKEVNEEEFGGLSDVEQRKLDELLVSEKNELNKRKDARALNGTETVELEIIEDEILKRKLKTKKRTQEEGQQLSAINRGQNEFFSYIYKDKLFKNPSSQLMRALELFEKKSAIYKNTYDEFKVEKGDVYQKGGFDPRDLIDVAHIMSSLSMEKFTEEEQAKFKAKIVDMFNTASEYSNETIEGTEEEVLAYKAARKEKLTPILDIYHDFIVGNGYNVCEKLGQNLDISKIKDEKILYVLLVVMSARQSFDTKLFKENKEYLPEKCKTYQELQEFNRKAMLVEGTAAFMIEEVAKCGLLRHFKAINNEFNSELQSDMTERRLRYKTEMNFCKTGNITIDVGKEIFDIAKLELDNNLEDNLLEKISIKKIFSGLTSNCPYIQTCKDLGTLIFVGGRSLKELAQEKGELDDGLNVAKAEEIILAQAIKKADKPIEFAYPTAFKNEIKFEVKPVTFNYDKKAYNKTYNFFSRFVSWFKNPSKTYNETLTRFDANKELRHNNIIDNVQKNFDNVRDYTKEGEIVFNQDLDKKYSVVSNKEKTIVKEVENKNTINNDNIIKQDNVVKDKDLNQNK